MCNCKNKQVHPLLTKTHLSSNLHVNNHQKCRRDWKKTMNLHCHTYLQLWHTLLGQYRGWTKPVARQTISYSDLSSIMGFFVLNGLRADQMQHLLKVIMVYLYSAGSSMAEKYLIISGC